LGFVADDVLDHHSVASADPVEPADLKRSGRAAASPVRLSMFTTLTTFGTPLDVTLAELAVELFYPADNGSADLLRGDVRP
jgi:hypothetical protein